MIDEAIIKKAAENCNILNLKPEVLEHFKAGNVLIQDIAGNYVAYADAPDAFKADVDHLHSIGAMPYFAFLSPAVIDNREDVCYNYLTVSIYEEDRIAEQLRVNEDKTIWTPAFVQSLATHNMMDYGIILVRNNKGVLQRLG